MPNKMLIDASHREETRVVVTRGNRIEEFDFESQDKKQLRGNIYLARVTRVEPSLQAAFVEYGGNRHGFLAFSEIHPDYYQIPVADRQAILRAEAEAAAAEEEDEEEGEPRRGRRSRGRSSDAARSAAAKSEVEEDVSHASAADADEFEPAADAEGDESDEDADEGIETVGGMVVAIEEFSAAEPAPAGAEEGGEDDAASSDAGEGVPAVGDDVTEREDQPVEEADSPRPAPTDAETATSGAAGGGEPEQGGGDDAGPSSDNKVMRADVEVDVVSEPAADVPEAETGGIEEVAAVTSEEVESVGAEDALEEVQSRRRTPRRHYKIQEVIKRRQILLVQVVKEERGNKGAALTTYLSLAGRYSVLMPNTARGGGISRKITSAQDRKRLKDIVKELEVPQGMGVILRTAGENRTKPEIKRDYEYLMRLWENVRSLTLKSVAPALVYEEGSLIKRSVRDLYNKDIDEILVAGDDGYREAKDFMRMLMPSHSKVVQPYRDTTPIFAKNGIEAQLDRMLQPQVTLKSGGYLVINQTEALVSIDVNSGRSTREHSIEDTALHTNLEAAEEVARQLRLRDLAGLIVIDFIDMEEHRNNRAVEKKLKDCLKNDRARIQVGRISHFGLLEMSRQRMRTSVLESTTKPCPHCGGTGHVRSDSSVALMVLRAIEEALLKDDRFDICVKTLTHTAFNLLNGKRGTLSDLEKRFSVTITIEADETVGAQHYAIVRGAMAEKPAVSPQAEAAVAAQPDYDEPEDAEDSVEEGDELSEEEDAADEESASASDEAAANGDRRRRRRRRKRGGRDREQVADAASPAAAADVDDGEDAEAVAEEPATPDQAMEAEDAEGDETSSGVDAAGGENRRRRRGKRGGRRNRRDDVLSEAAGGSDSADEAEGGVEEAEGASVASASNDSEVSTNAPADEADDRAVTEPDLDVVAGAEEAFDAEPDTMAAQPELIALPPDSESPRPEEAPSEPDPTDGDGSGERQRVSRRRNGGEAAVPAEPVVSSQQGGKPVEAGSEAPKRGGWWQRKGFF